MEIIAKQKPRGSAGIFVLINSELLPGLVSKIIITEYLGPVKFFYGLRVWFTSRRGELNPLILGYQAQVSSKPPARIYTAAKNFLICQRG